MFVSKSSCHIRLITPLAIAAFMLATSVRISAVDAKSAIRNAPLAPKESLKSIVLREEGTSAQLIAHEPLTIDPIEVVFDDAGRLWVVEMRDYPFLKSGEPSGRIRVLQDTNADGTYDKATTFADKLDMPTGIALWKNGAVVTLAGELAFFEDANSDLIADAKQQWITGFKIDNEQLRANHPRLGPDGWWYIACGLRGGNVKPGSHYPSHQNDEPINIGSRDIRFDPTTGLIETITGKAQFGLSFDSLGSRIYCSNRNPAVQVVFEQSELEGNPLAGLLPSFSDILPSGVDSKVTPLVNAWTTSNLHSGQFTAACGVFCRARPTEDVIVEEVYACEPTGSLVKCELLSRGTSTLQVIEQTAVEQEWLASSDPWFRPVNVCIAPTGETVVVDMHRAVIEHPRWVPEELKNRRDERWGSRAGRVFLIHDDPSQSFANEIIALNRQPIRSRPTEELVSLATSANPWYRDTASRILIEREDLSAVASLRKIALDGKQPTPVRIAATRLLCLLTQSWQDLDLLLRLDTSRALALSLLRSSRSHPVNDSLYAQKLLTQSKSRDDAMAFEALLCMSQLTLASLPPELVSRAINSKDSRFVIALAGALKKHPDRCLASMLSAYSNATNLEANESQLKFIAIAATALAKGSKKWPRATKNRLSKLCIESLGKTMSEASTCFALAALNALEIHHEGAGNFELLEQSLVAILQNTERSVELRRLACICLSRTNARRSSEVTKELLSQNPPTELEEQLLRIWQLLAPEDSNQYLMAALDGASPSKRGLAIQILSERPDGLQTLAKWASADGTDAGRILGPTTLRQLKDRAKGSTKRLFNQILGKLVNADRVAVIQRYQPALDLKGDSAKGRLLFQQQCASCHKIGGIGIDVGPDISDSRTKSHEQLLTSILDPNKAIDNDYFRFVVLLDNDQVIDGIIAEENAESIVMLVKDGKRNIIPRKEIVKLRATGTSLMPEGLEAQLNQQQMADLISYIKNWRYAGSSIPISQE